MAWASLASSLSKQGSPRPSGVLRITQVIVPPMLSLASRNWAIFCAIRLEASASGQRTGRKESTSSRVIREIRSRKSGLVAAVGCSGVGGKRYSLPMEVTNATISTPCTTERYFSAIAPAATRPIVSRALLRPPPLLALTPYFSW